MAIDLRGEDEAWIAYQKSFSAKYDEEVVNGSLMQSFVIDAGHKKVESHFKKDQYFGSVIEVGAGTGHHFQFIEHKFDRYVFTDFNTDALMVAKNKYCNKQDLNLDYIGVTSGPLPFADNSFDRLISTHVLEHIVNPHLAIKDWSRVVKPGGILSILIPTDPGLAWKLGRHFGPRKRALSQGLPYDYLMARDHVNSSTNLVSLLRYYFPNMLESWWPTKLASVDLNLFYIANIRNEK